MAERLTFHFEGALADEHQLNFYEAARFQYAAARLVVKLSQFRSSGKFVKKITNKSNKEITLEPHRDGSFDISILIPFAMVAGETFMNVSMSQLMSYLFERIVGKPSNKDTAATLKTIEKVVEEIGKIDENNSEQIAKALDIISKDQEIKDRMNSDQKDLYERLIAEKERESEVLRTVELRKIDAVREQKLLAMASPLVSDMATALRRSATSLSIKSQDATGTRKILYFNKKMAEEIELSSMDDEITTILVDIIQYNKETGWGKIRSTLSDQLLSFNIPSDLKARLQAQILASMNKDKVNIQAYVIRDRSGEPVRLTIVGILVAPDR